MTLSETATGTFSLGDDADADSLTDAVTEKACEGTIACEVTAEDGERRRLDTTATYKEMQAFSAREKPHYVGTSDDRWWKDARIRCW